MYHLFPEPNEDLAKRQDDLARKNENQARSCEEIARKKTTRTPRNESQARKLHRSELEQLQPPRCHDLNDTPPTRKTRRGARQKKVTNKLKIWYTNINGLY